MDLNPMMEAAIHEFKQTMTDYGNTLCLEQLTPALAEQVSAALKQALAAAGVAALRSFLKGYEPAEDTLVVGTSSYRYKQDSLKWFVTPFGLMPLPRRLYQADRGGAAGPGTGEPDRPRLLRAVDARPASADPQSPSQGLPAPRGRHRRAAARRHATDGLAPE